MRRTIFILLLAGFHWIANIAADLLVFDRSGLYGLFPKTGYRLASGISHGLEFPLVSLFVKIAGPDNRLLLPCAILNSLVWGTALYLTVVFARRLTRAAAKPIKEVHDA